MSFNDSFRRIQARNEKKSQEKAESEAQAAVKLPPAVIQDIDIYLPKMANGQRNFHLHHLRTPSNYRAELRAIVADRITRKPKP